MLSGETNMDGQDAWVQENHAAEVPQRPEPVVRQISFSDITDAISQGMRDFRHAPIYGLTFGVLYFLGGVLTTLTASALNMTYLTYPLGAGFALIGPLVAIGLYEVSRLIERGEPLSWGRVIAAIRSQMGQEIGWMSFVVLFILIVWLYQVRLLLALFLGMEPIATMRDFINVVLTTSQGWTFLAVGHVLGAILSVILFSLTVVSFPMLLDRKVDFITAMITSVRSVMLNPVPMLLWAGIIVALLIAASLPFFIGLIFVLPVLGHTSWHLYRRLVAPEEEETAPA
jgi:uncharacterized membrane protein